MTASRMQPQGGQVPESYLQMVRKSPKGVCHSHCTPQAMGRAYTIPSLGLDLICKMGESSASLGTRQTYIELAYEVFTLVPGIKYSCI